MPLPPRKDKYQKTVRGFKEKELSDRITCSYYPSTNTEGSPWVKLGGVRYWVMSADPLVIKTEDGTNTYIHIIKETTK